MNDVTSVGLISKKWMFLGVSALILLTIGATYYRVYVSQNYLVSYEVSCDVEEESCFLYECTAEDGEECEDSLYKVMTKTAADWKNSCESSDIEECERSFMCSAKDEVCEIEYCTPGNAEGIECVGPFDTLENASN